MAFPGHAGTLAAVSADVELATASATVPRSVTHISTLIRTGGGVWMLMHPLGSAGLYRVVFGSAEQDALPRQAPVTADEVARALTAVHGPDTKLSKLRWGSRFSDAARQVTNYRYGRVLFAGDAAHIHSPIGGQGLNLGVQDAMNLGWKLAAHVQDRATAGLLDSYHTERHPVAARVLATTRAQAVLMSPPPDADDLLALREIVTELARLPDANRYLAGLMSGLDVRYDLGDPDPLIGTRMIDLSLQTAASPTTVSTLLRPRRGLLLQLDGGQPSPPLDPAAPERHLGQRTGHRLTRGHHAGRRTRDRSRPDPTRRIHLLGRHHPDRITRVRAPTLVPRSPFTMIARQLLAPVSARSLVTGLSPLWWVCSVGGRSARGLMRRWVAGGRVAFPGFLVEQSADRRGRARTGSRGPVMWLAEGLGWAAE